MAYGLVPAMEDNGVVMYESTILNQYLAEAYPQTPLLPKDVGRRTRARVLENCRDKRLYPAMKVSSAAIRGVKKEEWERSRIDAAFDSLHPLFHGLEEELDGKDYLAGNYSPPTSRSRLTTPGRSNSVSACRKDIHAFAPGSSAS